MGLRGNTLSVDQVTAIFDNKKVFGPPKDILEVQNAISIYQDLTRFEALSETSYLEAHRILMKGTDKERRTISNRKCGNI